MTACGRHSGLAELFYRLFQRAAPRHGFSPGPPWHLLADEQRAILIEVISDVECVLRASQADASPGREGASG